MVYAVQDSEFDSNIKEQPSEETMKLSRAL